MLAGELSASVLQSIVDDSLPAGLEIFHMAVGCAAEEESQTVRSTAAVLPFLCSQPAVVANSEELLSLP